MEVKLLQRHDLGDINVILLSAFYMIKFETDDINTLLGPQSQYNRNAATRFENDYINKCFYCGCNSLTAGKEITHFIIRKKSLSHLFNWIIPRHDTKEKARHVLIILLSALLNGLKPGENVLIYDDNDKKFTAITDDSNDYNKIEQFVKSFLLFNVIYEIKHLFNKKQKNIFLTIYDAIKAQFGKNTDLKLFYTLIGDDCPKTPKRFTGKITFCRKIDRQDPICTARQFLNGLNIQNKEQYKEIGDFVGL